MEQGLEMACKNCGDENKPNRYQPVSEPNGVGDIDRRAENKKTIQRPPKDSPIDPYSVFLAARSLSYEELSARRKEQEKVMKDQSEKAIIQMTSAMRRIHVEEMVAVINYEAIAVQTVSPGQALRVLHELLQRPEFNDINTMYPKLKNEVNQRFRKLRENQLKLQ
jgi:hypothetical protein